MTDESTGCGLCGKEGGEDCESEGHSDERVIIELQPEVPIVALGANEEYPPL
jgi:hypothetical protein